MMRLLTGFIHTLQRVYLKRISSPTEIYAWAETLQHKFTYSIVFMVETE